MLNINNIVTSPYGIIDKQFNHAFHKIEEVYQLMKTYELINEINTINSNTALINNVNDNMSTLTNINTNMSSIIAISLKLTIIDTIFDSLADIVFFNGNYTNALNYLGLSGIPNDNNTLKAMFENTLTGKKNIIANTISINNPNSSINSNYELKDSLGVIKGYIQYNEQDDHIRIAKKSTLATTNYIDLYDDRIELSDPVKIQGKSLYLKNDIGSGVDLDTIVTDGYYNQSTNNNATSGSNYPVDKAGTLSVKADDNIIYQTYQTYDSSGTYYRSKYNDGWYTWRKVFDTGNDGTGTTLNADLLDGYDGASYRDASLLNTGTIADARLPLNITSNITGTAENANKLDNNDSTYYTNAANLVTGILNDLRLSTNVLKVNSEIGGSANLNTYQTTGIYKQSQNADAASGTNYPNAVAGILTVVNAAGFIYQLYQEYDGTDLYFRSYYDGSWFSWKRIFHTGNDGVNSSLDADLLDGQSSAYYRNPANLTGGIVPDAVLPLTITSNITGSAALLEGQNKAYYTNATNLVSGNIPAARLPLKQSWIPSGVTSYTASDCVYVDHGSAVTVSFTVVMTSDSTIGNFPFAPEATCICLVRNTFGDTGNISGTVLFAMLSSTTLTIQTTAASDGDTIQGTITYIKD